MTAPLRLIKDVSTVVPGLPPRGRSPDVGVVYATGSGRLDSLPDWRPLTYREQLRTAFRRRYDVDMSHHRRRAQMLHTPLPAHGDYFYFIAELEVGFRVHDPEEIVRRNLPDITRVLYPHLADEFRKITRKHDIEDSELAESEIISRFAGDDVLPDGITIFYVAPRLLPDERAVRYLREKRDALRRIQVGRAEHKVRLQAAMQRGDLDRKDREFERDMAERELAHLAGPLDAYDLVRHHLARHPGDTQGALELIVQHRKAWMEHQEQYNQRTAELFKTMVDSKLVQAADMERLLPQMLGQLRIVPPPVPVEATVGAEWDDPPVHAAGDPSKVIIEEPGPAAATENPPVYLVLDESADAEDFRPALNHELPGLLAALTTPAAGPAVRLAVLCYARHLSVRLPLGAPGPSAQPLGAGGAASYAALFAALADRVDADEPGEPALIYLLCAGRAQDDWRVARQRLTDPDLRDQPPEVIVFGVGDASAEQILGMATDRGKAFTAAPGCEPGAVIRHFAEYVIADLTRRSAGDRTVAPPDDFVPAVAGS